MIQSRPGRLLLVVFLLGCQEPAWNFVTEPCCTDQPTEADIRRTSPDLIYRAAGIWKFYDEFGEQLSPLAADRHAGLVPLWRRTLVADSPLKRFNRGPERTGMSVSSEGTVAIMTANRLWLLDGSSGVPRHIFVNFDQRRVGESPILYSDTSQPVVAFNPDGGGLWLALNSTPALISLSAITLRYGPLVEYAWAAGGDGGLFNFDNWVFESKAVGDDGTLYWSLNGTLVALEPSGRVRWTRAGGGYPMLDANGNVYALRGPDPIGVRVRDGEIVWRAEKRTDWERATGAQLEDQRVGDLIPINWYIRNGGEFAMHRVDGTIAWTVDAALLQNATVSIANDGTMYATQAKGYGATLEAWESTRPIRRWSLDVFSPDGGPDTIISAPIPAERKAGAYFLTFEGVVVSVDGDGGVTGWYDLPGQAAGYTPVLHDGVLYVVSVKPMGELLPKDEQIFPGFHVDGGTVVPNDWESYGCMSWLWHECGPAIRGYSEGVFYLYAFRVE